ncbi:YafY family protein [Zongyangia sp. HA2173]|uniref:helix-turn-helix transcriptional regulator n=1 Tax=Zongyangia sp. HA2173 TaxID=3133035 RepID=UPI0031696336
MKIDRLIGILSILLQKEHITAPELAERFEVSRRTISRDIEALCKAGIPIVTAQGQNGGISIMEGYKIDSTLLTSADMQAILAGLRSLDSVSGTNQVAQLMEKLSAGASTLMPGAQNILIDLSSWYKESLAPKIDCIRKAMDGHYTISFRYYAPKGESERILEPYYLIFRWSSWYVWGYCREKEDYRLFKLNRMEEPRLEGTFEERLVPLPDLSNERIFPGGIRVKALFEPECKWRLVEEFGTSCFEEQKDGKLLFRADYTDAENLLTWLLTFRDKVVLLEPKELQEELVDSLKKTANRYGEG